MAAVIAQPACIANDVDASCCTHAACFARLDHRGCTTYDAEGSATQQAYRELNVLATLGRAEVVPPLIGVGIQGGNPALVHQPLQPHVLWSTVLCE